MGFFEAGRPPADSVTHRRRLLPHAGRRACPARRRAARCARCLWQAPATCWSPPVRSRRAGRCRKHWVRARDATPCGPGACCRHRFSFAAVHCSVSSRQGGASLRPPRPAAAQLPLTLTAGLPLSAWPLDPAPRLFSDRAARAGGVQRRADPGARVCQQRGRAHDHGVAAVQQAAVTGHSRGAANWEGGQRERDR